VLIGKDADDMGAALEPLVDPLKPDRAFEMFAVLSRQTVKGKGFLIIAGRRNTSVQPDLLIRRDG
jgi:hypothetical protein